MKKVKVKFASTLNLVLPRGRSIANAVVIGVEIVVVAVVIVVVVVCCHGNSTITLDEDLKWQFSI